MLENSVLVRTNLSHEDMAQTVRGAMGEIAAAQSILLVKPLVDESILLESGLDSLGFAMLVASLEDKLGYDPFVLSDAPCYPSTLIQLIDFYVEHQPN